MNLSQWITENIKNFNEAIHSEEDVKIRVVLPFLKELGYDLDNIRYENSIEVRIGTKKTFVFSDIEVLINGKVEIVIDTKKPTRSISEKDVLQSASYAKLVATPPALYGITTNGRECYSTNIYTGQCTSSIPAFEELLRQIDKSKKRPLKDIQIREVESVLFTLTNQHELYRVIQECKNIIESRALIRSDQSFREMTKILLIKMNEERRVKNNEGPNRFTSDYVSSIARANDILEIEVFRNLFQEAKSTYPSIYTNKDENIQIANNSCILEIIILLEPFSFIGTGDDIKGAVYEIFLKATLRGDFDQYFTPREIVEFMVKFADPNIDDKILDPACGSGGFLIQAFSFINKKILASEFSEVEHSRRFRTLIDKCLWGHEADYDLHVLAKINLIMHGDGWNNIYQGDTLISKKLPENFFDLVLANPPFTLPYRSKDVLSKFELGIGKESEELDILFVEKSIKLLKPGSDLFIVLPEGLLNNSRYKYFRSWLLSKTDPILSVSLPEGAFIPFGGSVSKTCILGVRKKDTEINGYQTPNYVFLGNAVEVGFNTGKRKYIERNENDLKEFNNFHSVVFTGIKKTLNGGECGWLPQLNISEYRLDARFLLNKIDQLEQQVLFETIVPLKEICTVENKVITVDSNTEYQYLEVPDISDVTGTITNIRKMMGSELGSKSFHYFTSGDILFTRINPRKKRIVLIPQITGDGIVSKEVYRIVYKTNNYIPEKYKNVIVSLLQTDHVNNQIVRLSTGSSSSRARVQIDDLLNDVYVPIPNLEIQKDISYSVEQYANQVWKNAQEFLNVFSGIMTQLGSKIEKDKLRSI
jgi:type I restriction enzyme M protein